LIILASASPRRQELLKAVGLSFIVIPPFLPSAASVPEGHKQEVDETPLPGEAPAALVQRLSRAKAQAVAASLGMIHFENVSHLQDSKIVIIAADTEVVFEDKILGKPANAVEATHMLKQLRSQCHYVYSGLTVACLPSNALLSPTPPYQAESIFITRLHQSRVWMRSYTDAEIAAYVASGDPLDKAGAYAIQNQGFAPVERLEGCFASVMGLPLGELAVAFREIDLSLPESSPLCARYTGYPCCQNYTYSPQAS
jgi:septum formation protein